MKRIKNIWFSSLVVLLALNFADLTAQTDTLCFNDTILYRLPDSNGSVYQWTISGGTIIYSSTSKDSVIVVWNESTGLHSVEAVRLTENSCSSESEKHEVFVYNPFVDLGNDRAICEGSIDLLVAVPEYEEYFWNNRPGTNEFVINAAGIITLEVKDKYGCRAVDSILVIQTNTPEPEFRLSLDTLNWSVMLFNLSDSSWQFYWDFGDGTYSNEYNPGIHTYAEPGTYKITLSATVNDCSGTISNIVSIVEPLLADFIAVIEGCAPVEVTFINLSTSADSYYWVFGNGSASTDETPVTIYSESGKYEVTLYAQNETDTSISKKSVYVNRAPIANFDVIPSETTTYKEIDFINKSSGAVRYLWDFGDGENSELYEPIHSYSAEGMYDISLSVWSESGCYDSLLVDNAVMVKQQCRIQFPSGFIPNKSGPGGGYYDPLQIPDNNEVFHPIYENLDAYELKIYNRWGELIFSSLNINQGWDGYYKGKLAPQDTYIYHVKATCLSGEEIKATGSVTLIY
jgi:gliding motility-associated-like protein